MAFSASILSQYGRHGDSLVAQLTPQQVALLKALGGAGTQNPVTKMPEFYDVTDNDAPDLDLGGRDRGEEISTDGSDPLSEAALTSNVNPGKLDLSLMDRFGGWLSSQLNNMTPLDLSSITKAGSLAFTAIDDFAKDRLEKAINEGRVVGYGNTKEDFDRALSDLKGGTVQVKGEGLFGETTSMGVGPGGMNNGGNSPGGGADGRSEIGGQLATAITNSSEQAAPAESFWTKWIKSGAKASGTILDMPSRGPKMGFSSILGADRAPMNAPQRGGWGSLAEQYGAMGRDGDTIVAHINPQEAQMLKAMGGRGTINPRTGFMEFAPIDPASQLYKLITADTGDAQINQIHSDFLGAYNAADDAARSGIINDYNSRRQARLNNLNDAGLARFKQTYEGKDWGDASPAHMLTEASNILSNRSGRNQYLRGATGITTGVGAIDALNREYAEKLATGLGDADFNTLTQDIQRRRQQLLPGLSLNDLNRYKSAYAGTAYSNLVGEAEGILNGLNGTSSFLSGVIGRESGVNDIERLHDDYWRDWQAAGGDAARQSVTRRYEDLRRVALQGLSKRDLDRFDQTYGDLTNLHGEYTSETDRRTEAEKAASAANPLSSSAGWIDQFKQAMGQYQQLQGLFGSIAPQMATGYAATPGTARRWRVDPLTGQLIASGGAARGSGFGSTVSTILV